MEEDFYSKFRIYFDMKKDWVIKLYSLLCDDKRIHRYKIEALDARKYFMRDQIDRLITLGIVGVIDVDRRGKPLLIESKLYEGKTNGNEE